MKRRILLVDDDENVTRGLRLGLRGEPYEVVTAASAEEALAILAEQPVHVVVSDERMPGMGGSELLARVRRLQPSTVRIILTGEASLEAAVRAINEGQIYRFLRKPCGPNELRITIRQSMEHLELLETARRLLDTSRRQTSALEALEEKVPGITRVERDDSGAVVVDEEDARDVDALIKEALEGVERAESVLRRVVRESV